MEVEGNRSDAAADRRSGRGYFWSSKWKDRQERHLLKQQLHSRNQRSKRRQTKEEGVALVALDTKRTARIDKKKTAKEAQGTAGTQSVRGGNMGGSNYNCGSPNRQSQMSKKTQEQIFSECFLFAWLMENARVAS